MFDKECSGSISIEQVNHYITKFDEMHQQTMTQGNTAAKRPQWKGGRAGPGGASAIGT